MARPLRVEYPGAYYHVISRGNAGEDIFKNDRAQRTENGAARWSITDSG